MGDLVFFKLDNAVSLQPKKCSPFHDTKPLFANKTNNLHHLRSGIETVSMRLGLRYHQIQIIELDFFTTLWQSDQGEYFDMLIIGGGGLIPPFY